MQLLTHKARTDKQRLCDVKHLSHWSEARGLTVFLPHPLSLAPVGRLPTTGVLAKGFGHSLLARPVVGYCTETLKKTRGISAFMKLQETQSFCVLVNACDCDEIGFQPTNKTCFVRGTVGIMVPCRKLRPLVVRPFQCTYCSRSKQSALTLLCSVREKKNQETAQME